MPNVGDVVCLIHDTDIANGVFLKAGTRGEIHEELENGLLVKFDEVTTTVYVSKEDSVMIFTDDFSQYMNPPQEEISDPVNHPSHYNNNGYECIKVMEAIYGYEKVKIFCELNAFKYLWRAGHKEGESEKKDIKKANWYTDRAKTILEKLEGDNDEKL